MSDRNLRRMAGKKNARDLAATIHALKASAAGLKELLPGAQAEMGAAEEAAREFSAGIREIQYRLDRQHAVFLRHLIEHDRPALTQEEFDETTLERDVRFEAEYDAVRFFMWLAMLGEP
jgi:hypothetical protein